MLLGQNNTKKIMLIRSAGFSQEWVDEMMSDFPEVQFVVADDNETSIHSQITGVNVLIGCPRPLFTPQLLEKAAPYKFRDEILFDTGPGSMDPL